MSINFVRRDSPRKGMETGTLAALLLASLFAAATKQFVSVQLDTFTGGENVM